MKALAALPRTDALLLAQSIEALPWDRGLKKAAIAEVLDELRTTLREGKQEPDISVEAVAARVQRRLDYWLEPGPRPVINATGVLLHTNVGRAPFAQAAVDAMVQATQCCDLEIDMTSGDRGSRYTRIRPLMSHLVGAQDIHVANNGAGALLLACSALAGPPGERIGAVMSRGQMVEIGDGFRVTTMAAAGGAKIVEVGSTNRTHLRDYAAALDEGDPKPAAILWAHLSNFAQAGYIKHPSITELSQLCDEKGAHFIVDIGSGSLGRGIPGDEPTVREYLEQGAHIVTFSGDKLFGGPQAGMLAGRAELIAKVRKHPLARALRPDKTTLAALHATLREHGKAQDPAIRLHEMIRFTKEELRARCELVTQAMGWSSDCIVEMQGTIGGGSLPGDLIESVGLCVPEDFGKARHRNTRKLAQALRCATPRLLGRVSGERLYLDLRTVNPKDQTRMIEALKNAECPQ